MNAILTTITLLIAGTALAQSFSETIKRDMVFEKESADNALMIANINGNVTVEGYDGDRIVVEVKKWVSGKTTGRLEKGKQEIQLGVIDRADTIILFTKDGCGTFGRIDKTRNRGWSQAGWGYDWNCNTGNCDRDNEYDYKMDFLVKVPAGTNILVSTVNDGDINVSGVKGGVRANNINGSIRLTSLTRETEASTVNGDVDIEYTAVPGKECRFYSLNGDINASFPKGLAANMSFESFNGDFYTNVEKIQTLPLVMEKSNKGEGIRYKVNGNRYQIGNGGVFLDFETFNGNVYLKEK